MSEWVCDWHPSWREAKLLKMKLFQNYKKQNNKHVLNKVTIIELSFATWLSELSFTDLSCEKFCFKNKNLNFLQVPSVGLNIDVNNK